MQASELFSEADRQAISAAVAAAEQRTTGEIVPVVASVSGRYDRAEDLFGVAIAMLMVGAVWWCLPVSGMEPGWPGQSASGIGLLLVLATFFAGFIAGAAAASWIPVLRLPFISKAEMTEEVARRAAECFYRFRVRATAGGTGIVIYVSLYERMVRVLGDEAVAARIDASRWDEICRVVAAGLAGGKPAGGLIAAIGQCGALLGEHFPAAPGDVNELGNELHLVD